MSKPERFTNATGAPVPDNTNILTAGRRGPALLQDIWLIEKLPAGRGHDQAARDLHLKKRDAEEGENLTPEKRRNN